MKSFKLFRLLWLGVTLTVIVYYGITLLPLDDKENDKNAQTEQIQVITNGYTFKVVNADGTAAKNYMVTLCNFKDGCTGGMDTITGDNGVASVKADAGVYEIHLQSMDDSTQPKFDAKAGDTTLAAGEVDGMDGEYPLTPSSYGTLIELTLK